MKDTRKARVDHFANGHLVHPATRLQPTAAELKSYRDRIAEGADFDEDSETGGLDEDRDPDEPSEESYSVAAE